MNPKVKKETKVRITVMLASKFSYIVSNQGIKEVVELVGAWSSSIVVAVSKEVKLEPKGNAVKGDLNEFVGSSCW